jgi:hypothetical protein
LKTVWISPLKKSKLVLQIWISTIEKSIFRATVWISPMEKSKQVPKIWICPSEKSIYAYIYTKICVTQMCACLEADVDFSDGEIQVFDTSLDFPIREIQTAATNMDFCNGEICILGDCLEFPNGYIQTGAKKKDFPIGEIHICMQIYTYLGYPNMCMCTSRYGFLQGEIQVFETSLDFSVGEI